MNNESKGIEELRKIILQNDRKTVNALQEKINDPNFFAENTVPLIEERINILKNSFPVEYRQVVDKIIEEKLSSSQDELLDIIYPKLGLMIKKYVQEQFQILKESIDNQVYNFFNKGLLGRIRYSLFGISKHEKALILANADMPEIEEIFVIENYSGLLLGSASKNKTVDMDIIGGMLTAIKLFVEDAFLKGEENLESINYGTYTILVENFYSYYIAVVVSGSLSSSEKEKLSEKIIKFARKELRINVKKLNEKAHVTIKQKLNYCFFPLVNKRIKSNH